MKLEDTVDIRLQRHSTSNHHNKLWRFLILVAATALFSMPAAAQVAAPLKSDIPFPFTVVDTQLPPGSYVIRALDDPDDNVFEIASADQKTKVWFLAGETDSVSLATKPELEFHKYGDREFLSQILEEGTSVGVMVDMGHAERRLIKQKAKRATHRHPATR